MKILGISDSHNSSASLLVGGRLVAALQEERPARKKNVRGLPVNAIRKVLEIGGLSFKDLDQVAFSDQTTDACLEFSRDQTTAALKTLIQMEITDVLFRRSVVSLRTALYNYAHGWIRDLFGDSLYRWEVRKKTKERLKLFYERFPEAKTVPVHFFRHHDAHFATACFGPGASAKDRLVFTYDGLGDRQCGSVSRVRPDGTREVLCAIDERDSLGNLWTFVTLLMGFVPLEHEYKLMGMAPYASRERSDKMALTFEKLYRWTEGYFQSSCRDRRRLSYFQSWLAGVKESLRLKRFDDICGGLQEFTETALAQWVGYWVKKTGIRDICLSGGIFLNVKANLRIMNLNGVESIFIFPSCGDETNSIGACYLSYFQKSGRFPEPLKSLYLGPEWSEAVIGNALKEIDSQTIEVELCEDMESKVARLLAGYEVVARFCGREEFGARALGNRSILAHPGRWSAVAEINDMIKKRDFWMPFACSILYEEQDRYIRNPKKNGGEYMIMAFEGGPEIDSIAAGIHPRDKTVRAQIVNKDQAPDYHRLIGKFKELTGIGAILNTSLNLHGFPLVHTPQDALYVFENSGLRYMALGRFLLSKKVPGLICRSTEAAGRIATKIPVSASISA